MDLGYVGYRIPMTALILQKGLLRSASREPVGKFIATLAVIILIFIAYRALTGGGGIDDVSNAGCETTLCCPDCDVISVTRIIDGDTFVSG